MAAGMLGWCICTGQIVLGITPHAWRKQTEAGACYTTVLQLQPRQRSEVGQLAWLLECWDGAYAQDKLCSASHPTPGALRQRLGLRHWHMPTSVKQPWYLTMLT